MAVPKKRTGKSAQGHRRANWKATKPEVTTCSHCGETVLTHTVCPACGYYKGKAVSIKSAEYVAEPAKVEEKKAPKKRATKAKKPAEEVIEAEVVEETKAEEVVSEETPAEDKKEESAE